MAKPLIAGGAEPRSVSSLGLAPLTSAPFALLVLGWKVCEREWSYGARLTAGQLS